MRLFITLFTFLASSFAMGGQYIITGSEVVKDLNLKPLYMRQDLNAAVVKVSEKQKAKISRYMHNKGRCGGYELVELKGFKSNSGPFHANQQKQLEDLFKYMEKKFQVSHLDLKTTDVPEFSQDTADAVGKVSPLRLQEDVTWISSYHTRHHTSATKNDHVAEMQRRLQALVKASGRQDVAIDLVTHTRTAQKTVRASIRGSNRPNEIVAMGAHFDSTNQSFFESHAPGADDDASGSANILEAFRLLLDQPAPQRTLQFYWYAAEEVGLVGSAELARSYRSQNADVISVLQLDMTLYPGSGKYTMGFMTDFTNPAFRNYLAELNRLYVKAKIVESKCGYGCSDHASWHRQGYAAAIPFESTMEQMNRRLHTTQDLISERTDFEHSATFSQLAMAYALSVGNSDTRFVKR